MIKRAHSALFCLCKISLYEHGDTVQIYNDIIADMELTKKLLNETSDWDEYYVVDCTTEFQFNTELEVIHNCDIVENGGRGSIDLVMDFDVYVINGEHYVKASDFQEHFPIC